MALPQVTGWRQWHLVLPCHSFGDVCDLCSVEGQVIDCLQASSVSAVVAGCMQLVATTSSSWPTSFINLLPPLLCCVCAGEDDGFLMVYVTKPGGSSFMHVYDAKTMDATPVAEVRGTHRL